MGKLFSTINDSFLYPKNLEHSQKVMERLSPQAQPDKTLLAFTANQWRLGSATQNHQ